LILGDIGLLVWLNFIGLLVWLNLQVAQVNKLFELEGKPALDFYKEYQCKKL